MPTGKSTYSFREKGPSNSHNSSLPALLCILLLAFPALAQQSPPREVLEAPGVSISFASGQKYLARDALALYPKIHKDLQQKLGMAFDQKAYVYLCRSEKEFHDVTGGYPEKWAAALAFPSNRLIVVDASKLEPAGDHSIRATLSHEMVHLILGRIQRKGVEVPAWFNEGVAIWASRPQFPFPRDKLVLAAKGGSLPDYRSLHHSFPSSPAQAELAYAASHNFTSYLEHEFGTGTISAILAAMDQGLDVESAVVRVTSGRLEDLWDAWRSGLLRSRGALAAFKLIFQRWWGWFALLGLLVVVAYARFLFVKRRKMKMWEEEEQLGYW